MVETPNRRSRFNAAGAVIALLFGLVALAGAALYPTFRDPPTPIYEAPTSLAEAQLQDLEHLRRVLAIDRSFTPEERGRFNRELESLGARVGDMDRAAFEMGVSRAAAAAGNGHTNVLGANRGLDLNSLPVRAVFFSEGFYVVSATEPYADLIGARIVSIDGVTPAEITAAAAPYVGGTPEFKREMAPNILLSPAALHAIGVGATPSQSRIVFATEGGDTERVVPASDRPLNGPSTDDRLTELRRELHWPRRNLSPLASIADPLELRHALERASLPGYLRNPDRFYWHEMIGDSKTLYVQINAVRNEAAGPSLVEYLTGVMREARTRSVGDVVVDLRFCAGGNYQLTADFTRRLPDILGPDARIYIVTSGNTWSAGLVTAARLKHFAADRGAIVGEMVGDTPQFWAEGKLARLPNLRLRIGYATAYHDWENGCSWLQAGYCFFLNYSLGVAAGDLTPEIPAPLRFVDFINGRDSAMLAIEADRALRSGL